MPEEVSILNYILSLIALGGVAFGIARNIRRPTDILAKENTEADRNAALLAQAVTMERESNDKKFMEFNARLEKSTELAQNHIHEIKNHVESLAAAVNATNIEVAKLSTIITERIPK